MEQVMSYYSLLPRIQTCREAVPGRNWRVDDARQQARRSRSPKWEQTARYVNETPADDEEHIDKVWD